MTRRAADTWPAALGAWDQYMRLAAQPAETVKLRLYHLGRTSAAVGATPATLTFDALAGWLVAQEWAPNTRRSYRTSLRAFYAWAMASGRVTSSPAHLLPPVRVPRARPRPAPEPAYAELLEVRDERVLLAALLAGACGLRRGELARSRQDHLERDLLGWSLRVVGKGGHTRLVPVPDEAARMILARPAGWLFPSSHGGHLTPHYLSKLISAELPAGLTTHTLRHRCGTISYARTKDLRAVQELLGHAKPETTAIYTEIGPEAVRAAMRAAYDGDAA